MSKRNRSTYEEKLAAPFVKYGTALPPLQEGTRDDGSYVPVWKQEVTDERGRKRLHGAFTGGFSAGYFNTVGSKEGWTPATFKSSRGARAKATEVRPEDFMDEEDLREAEEARNLETNPDFAGFGDGSTRKPVVLMDLLAPSGHDTMGMKLLKKMGWKEGQGIGAKLRRKAKDIDDPTAAVHNDDDQEEKTYLFAPKNTSLILLERKNNARQGIGYTSEMSLDQPEDSKKESPPSGGNSKPRRTGPAFGTGILNDADEDDDDPYEIRPKTSYNRTIGGDKPKKVNKDTPVRRQPTKHVFVSKKGNLKTSTQAARKCHDGRSPLPGFMLSSDSVYSQIHYPPPEVPAEWAPKSSSGIAAGIAPQTVLDFKSRGAILGETPLAGKSVFDYISSASRNRLVSMTGNTQLPQGLGEAPASNSASSSLEDLVPPLDKDAAMAALKNAFMPYADDPEKRNRYRSFLEVKSGLREGLPDRKYGMHTQDWIRELREFVGAARIFKPLTGAIAMRFASASTVSEAEKEEKKKAESSAADAAKMGMYGPLTRETRDFTPVHLLCKRFNVPLPTVVDDDKAERGPETKPEHSLPVPEVSVGGDPVGQPARVQVVNSERNEALESEKAADDVFQAIFGDSDEEDDN